MYSFTSPPTAPIRHAASSNASPSASDVADKAAKLRDHIEKVQKLLTAEIYLDDNDDEDLNNKLASLQRKLGSCSKASLIFVCEAVHAEPVASPKKLAAGTGTLPSALHEFNKTELADGLVKWVCHIYMVFPID